METEQNLFRLPQNKKRIGQGTEEMDVYIEDYVMSFIHYLGKQCVEGYNAVVLLGENKTWEEKQCLLIRGAIRLQTINLEKELLFSKEEWEHIYHQVEEHFRDASILGWALIKPGMVLEPDEKMEQMHVANFSGNDKILLLYDPLEQKENIFWFRQKKLQVIHTYYLYYEKNQQMQEYMLMEKGNVAQEQVDQTVVQGMKKRLNEMAQMQTKKQRKKKWVKTAVVIVGIGVSIAGIQYKNVGQEVWKIVEKISQQSTKKEEIALPEEKKQIHNQGNTIENSTDQTKKDSDKKTQENKIESEETEDKEKTENLENKNLETGNQQIKVSEKETIETEKQQTEVSEKENIATEDLESKTVASDNNIEPENQQPKNTATENKSSETSAQDNVKPEMQKTENKNQELKNLETDPLNEENTEKAEEALQQGQAYIVQPGDTLAKICMAQYRSLEYMQQIKEWNQITDENRIIAGQILQLP